jgi:hypothetical protein
MHDLFFPKIYEIPRAYAARVLCASFVPVNSTVNLAKFRTEDSYHDCSYRYYTVNLIGTKLAHQARAANVRGIS